MSTHNIPFSIYKENQLKLSQICSYQIFSKGLKDEFEIAMVNEQSVFKPLKFYCIYGTKIWCLCMKSVLSHFIFDISLLRLYVYHINPRKMSLI